MCDKAKQIIKDQGHEGIYVLSSDGKCPTNLFYHLAECKDCTKSDFVRLETAKPLDWMY